MNLSSAIKQGSDLYFLYTFIKRLSTPFKDTKAFELGIIDNDGKILKKRKELETEEEKNAYTLMDTFIFNMKKLISKVPFGNTRFASYAAALFMLRENNVIYNLENDELEFDYKQFEDYYCLLSENQNFLDQYHNDNMLLENWSKEDVNEDSPVNAAGSGAIAGLGVDAPGKPGSGEPPVKSKLNKKKVLRSNEFMINPKSFIKTKIYKESIDTFDQLIKLIGLNEDLKYYHDIFPTKDLVLVNERTLEEISIRF